MVEEGPYSNGSILWEFKNDAELAVYKGFRKRRIFQQDLSCLEPGLLAVLILSLRVTTKTWQIIVVLFLLLSVIVLNPYYRRGYYEGRYGLSAVELFLNPHRLVLIEKFGGKTMILGSVKAKTVKSVQWLSDGCWFEVGSWYSRKKRFLLPQEFFRNQADTAALEAWAENYGIEIEGVPPLGFYPRPVEETRKL